MSEYQVGKHRFDEEKGVHVHDVHSAFQHGAAPVEVLLPSQYEVGTPYPVLYILPVHPGIGGRWGDGLQTARGLRIHDRYGLICVSPSFDAWPYYGAHHDDPGIRHEEFILEALIPAVEGLYATKQVADDRLLLGFSKSGWGALSLLLRHPGVFGFAASWDAPLMMSEKNFGLYETAEHFGTAEAMRGYVPAHWAKRNARYFQRDPRLAVLGRNFFGTRWLHDLPHTWRFHRLLDKLGIQHLYDNSIRVPHTWNPAWMQPAVQKLMCMTAGSARSGRLRAVDGVDL